MRIQIKDLQSSKPHDVGPNGAVLGRERKRTDIAVRNESVSKRHARIFLQDNVWYLEDLNSSNGTFIGTENVLAPTKLRVGDIFSLAQHRFEVTAIDNPAETAMYTGESVVSRDFDDDIAPPSDVGYPPGLDADLGTRDRPPTRDRGYPDDDLEDRGFEDDGYDDDDQAGASKGVVGNLIGSALRSIPYYMKTVPLLLFNPLGTVRKGIELQELPALDRMELIGWAFPAMLTTSLLGQICAIIAMIIGGAFSFGAVLTGLIVAPIGALIGSVITGLLWHPLGAWFINLLKGSSNEKSRSNYAAMTFAVTILAAVPNGLATLIGAIPLPFLPALGPLLTVAAVAITIWVAYSWIKAFRMVRWFQIVILALGGLAVVGSLLGFVTTLVGQFRGGTPSSGSAVIAQAAEAAKDAEASAKAQGAGDEGDDDGADDDSATAKDDSKGEDDQDEDKDDQNKDKDDKPAVKDKPKAAEARPEPEPEADDEDEAEPAPEPHSGGSKTGLLPKPNRPPAASEFLEHQAKLDEIQAAFRSHPQKLLRRPKVLNAYQELLDKTDDLTVRFNKRHKGKKQSWRKEIRRLQLKVEIFKGTERQVKLLHQEIFGS